MINYIHQLYRGRIGRKNYALGILFFLGVFMVLSSIDIFIFFRPMVTFIILVILLVAFAVHVFSLHARRFHDIGQSGLWIFLLTVPLVGFITLIVLFAKKGQDSPNQFGDSPPNDTNFLDAIFNKIRKVQNTFNF
jgi:uncharacterized membrane protein YhaH (DUF805 family)